MSEIWPEAEYARRNAAGELAYQRCGSCHSAVFFPRVLCPVCGATELGWETSAGAGTVYSATTIFSRKRDPYTVALVDLEEGIRLMTRIEDAAPGQQVIGRSVRVRPIQIDDKPATTAVLADEGSRGDE